MGKKKHFFDWKWDNEKSKSAYQLVIEQSSTEQSYLSAKISGDDIIFTVRTTIVENNILKETTKEISFNLNKYLKALFIRKYSILDPIDLEAFLEYHFKVFKGDKKEFLKHIKTILMGMKVLNQFDLNPRGRIKIGKRWVKEKLTTLENTEKESKSTSGLGKPPPKKTQSKKEDLKFDKAFEGKKFSDEEILQMLQNAHYIDENYKWREDLHGWQVCRALIQCLIKHKMVHEKAKKCETLFRILRQRIEIRPYKRASEKAPEDLIKDFERLFGIT